MAKDTRKTVLLAKSEVTYDLDPTPSPTVDAILAMNVDIKENAGVVNRDAQWKFLDQLPSLLGEQWSEINFKIPVIGSGTPGTAPRIGAILKACGMGETVVSNTSVTYGLISDNHSSCTLYIYKDGRLHIMTGCRGTGKLLYEAGKALYFEGKMWGRYAAPTVVALPVTVTYESTVKVPPVCKSSAFAYNSKTSLVVGSFELDFGVNVVKRPSLSDANAIAGFEITDRAPKFSIDPEAQFETSYNFRADWLTTQRVINIVATRAAGNIITTNITNANITNISYDDREGILVEKIEGECAASAGNDAFTIAFT